MTIHFRQAVQSDNDALLSLSKVPMELPDRLVSLDYSPSFFAQLALRKRSFVYVYHEDNGRIVAYQGFAIYIAQVQGKLIPTVFFFGGRTHKDMQGRGLHTNLLLYCEREARSLGAELGYTHFEYGNLAAARAGKRVVGDRVTNLSLEDVMAKPVGQLPHVTYFTLDTLSSKTTRTNDGSVRHITRDDVENVVELINSTHTEKDLFTPYTAETLHSRLDKHSSYIMDDVFVRVNRTGVIVAVAGLWNQSVVVREIHIDRQSGARKILAQQAVADWGLLPGHEDDFLQLIDHLRGVAESRGTSQVMLPTDSRYESQIESYFSVRPERVLLRVWSLASSKVLPRMPFYFDPIYY